MVDDLNLLYCVELHVFFILNKYISYHKYHNQMTAWTLQLRFTYENNLFQVKMLTICLLFPLHCHCLRLTPLLALLLKAAYLDTGIGTIFKACCQPSFIAHVPLLKQRTLFLSARCACCFSHTFLHIYITK